jgi:hypothetical protein
MFFSVATRGSSSASDTSLASMNSASGLGGGDVFPYNLTAPGNAGQCQSAGAVQQVCDGSPSRPLSVPKLNTNKDAHAGTTG